MEQSTLEASHTLYQMQESGNCYKIRLLMKQLDLPVNLVPVDITRGESRTDDFLEKNINGRVPVLELPDGSFLAESNAILWYLAEGSRFVPSSTIDRARVLQWMFFEQYSHEPFIATSRYWISILGEAEKYARELEQKRPGGYAALDVMDKQLARQDFLVGNSYSIADIALFAYTHVAHEGNFDLSSYRAINGWIARITDQPGYIQITD
jgi:glutathione S-transferase